MFGELVIDLLLNSKNGWSRSWVYIKQCYWNNIKNKLEHFSFLIFRDNFLTAKLWDFLPPVCLFSLQLFEKCFHCLSVDKLVITAVYSWKSSLLVLRDQWISIKIEGICNGMSQGFGTNLYDWIKTQKWLWLLED